MFQKNMYKKKIINFLMVVCISAYGMEREHELRKCHVLSLARITKKNSWSDDFPIQYSASTSWLTFDPTKQNKSIGNNCDILTVKPAFLASLRYFKQEKVTNKLEKIQTDHQYYNITSRGKVEGTSIGLTFLLMHFLQDLQMTSTKKTVFASTGCLNDERSLEISSVGGIVEKHEALIDFLESVEPEEIYFFYPKKNDDQLLEKAKGITYFPIENAKELAEKLQGLDFSRQSSFAAEPVEPIPYIENDFYQEYLETLIKRVKKNYRKKTISLLCDAYSDYQYSIDKAKSLSIKEQMSDFLVNDNISLSDQYKIIDLISEDYINLTEKILKNLILFAIENQDFKLYQLINLYCNVPSGKFILNNYLKEIKNKENTKEEDFLKKLEEAKKIDDLINISLIEEKFNEDSINTFLKKLEKLCAIETRSKYDEESKYVNSFQEFIETRLKKEKKKDLVAFFNWQLTGNNLKNKHYLWITSSHIFKNFIGKDVTINWILQAENLLGSNVIEFFASKEVPLQKKLDFLKDKKKILEDREYYTSFCNKKALHELCSSEEGQKKYLEIIANQKAYEINNTLLALVYTFFNYTGQQEIENNAKTVFENFKNMNSNQKSFVSEYGDKKFIAFLESEKKEYKKLNEPQRE